MGQNQQNLRQLQTTISEARNNLLTNFQRLVLITIHVHMVCVQKSDKERVKNGAKSTKSEATSNCNISSLKQAFDILSKARINYNKVTWAVRRNMSLRVY